MKTSKRIIYIFLAFTLIIQTSLYVFATDSNENDYSITNAEENGINLNDEDIIKATEAEIKELLQEQRRSKSTALSQEERTEIGKVNDRTTSIIAIEQEIQDYINASTVKSTSQNRKVTNLSPSFSGGNGTSSDPYIITTPEQMTYISQNTSAHYSLSNDIDMSEITWIPIGAQGPAFEGTFNGNMHVISNLTIDSSSSLLGIFGLCNGATIENATLTNSDISGGSYVGGFVGIASSTTLSNLTVENSNISGSNLIGGIVGACNSGVEIYGCTNSSVITATASDVGGIVAFMNGTRINDCISTGEVNGDSNVGGIAGTLQCDANRCTNTGEVNGNYTVGGIAGYIVCVNGRTAYIFNCFNSGNIFGEIEVAGIAGYALSMGSGVANIFHSANAGTITATGYAGGITGDSGCNLYISSCYNNGEIAAEYRFGGLVGRLNPSTSYDGVLLRSYNAGKVVSLGGSGSLVGYNAGYLVNILYYLDKYSTPLNFVDTQAPDGMNAPPFGTNNAYNAPTPTMVTKGTLREMSSTLANLFVDDEEWINKGYPIKSGINYVFSESYPIEYPVVIVPGIIGSRLNDDQGEALWLPSSPGEIAQLTLDTEGQSVNTILPAAIGYGIVNVYAPLAEQLSMKFGREDVYFFSYDWRLDNRESAEKLEEFIDTVVCAPKVNIVAHSMGGVVSACYIANDNSEKVNKMISLGSPYLGSSKVPYLFSTGKLIDPPFPIANILEGSFGELRKLSSHMASAYQLLPYLNLNPYIAVQDPGDEPPQDLTTRADSFDFIENNMILLGVDGQPIQSTVKGNFLHSNLNNDNPYNSNSFMEHLYPNGNPEESPIFNSVDTYILVGYGEETIGKLTYDSTGMFIDDITFSSGDGTVPLWSAMVNTRVDDEVTMLHHNVGHLGFLFDTDVFAQIIDILQNTLPILDENSIEEIANDEYIVVRIAADADVSITHEGETLTNIDGIENTETEFGSMYLIGENEDVIIMTLSADVDYNIEMDSFSSETLDYDIRFFDSTNNLIEERSFVDIPTTAEANIISNTSQIENTVLSMDISGTGVFSENILPDEISR